jgi:hypothetical protein
MSHEAAGEPARQPTPDSSHGLLNFVKRVTAEEAAAARKARSEATRERREQLKLEEALEAERKKQELKDWEAKRKREYRAKKKADRDVGVDIALGRAQAIVIDEDGEPSGASESVIMISVYRMHFEAVVRSSGRRGGDYDGGG